MEIFRKLNFNTKIEVADVLNNDATNLENSVKELLKTLNGESA